jgi:hypothetical protein
MFTGLRRGPEPAPHLFCAVCTRTRTLRPIVSAATDQARSVNNTVIASAVLCEQPIVTGCAFDAIGAGASCCISIIRGVVPWLLLAQCQPAGIGS